MRLRSFSLSKVIPVELINLVIQESSDSKSTLLAWSLVSLGCLQIANPLLNQHVLLSKENHLLRVVRRITHANEDAVLLLPRLALPLSLKNVKRLTFANLPNLYFIKGLTCTPPSNLGRRGELILDFAFDSNTPKERLILSTFLIPRLATLLRPRRVCFHLIQEVHVELESWALEAYLTAISLVPYSPYLPILPFRDDELSTGTELLLETILAAVSKIQTARRDCLDFFDVAFRPLKILCGLEGCPRSVGDDAMEEMEALRKEFLGEEKPGLEELERERVEGRWKSAEEVINSLERRSFAQVKGFTDRLLIILDRTIEAAQAYSLSL